MLIFKEFLSGGVAVGKARRRLTVEGYVQGVFYRAYTEKKARQLQVFGWVRNRPNGTVEILAEGEESRVAELIRWCHTGPPGATVTRVQVEEEPFQGEFRGFDIVYG